MAVSTAASSQTRHRGFGASVALLLSVALSAGVLGAPPAQAQPPDLFPLAGSLLGGYLEIVDNERDFARHLVTSAELLDWRAKNPQKSEAAMTEHANAIQRGITTGVPEQTALSHTYELVGASLVALRGVPDVVLDGPRIDQLTASLTGRDIRPLSGHLEDRLTGSLREYTWNAMYEDTRRKVWAEVGAKARADASFTRAWNAAIGDGAGVSAAADATEIAGKPQLKLHFDITPFLPVQTKPDELKIVTEKTLAETIKKTYEDRKLWFKDLKAAADKYPPGTGAQPDEQAKKKAEDEEKTRQEAIDGAKTAFDALAFYVKLGTGSAQAGRDIQTFASGVIQVATAVNKCITAFSLINTAFSLATVAFTGNVIGAISTLVGLFASAGPSVEELILKEISALREQVEGLRKEMNAQFDRIDTKLNAVYKGLSDQLGELKGTVAEIKSRVTGLATQLAQMESQLRLIGEAVVKGLAAVLAQDVWRAAGDRIDFAATHHGERITKEQYNGAEGVFHDGAITTATQQGPFVPVGEGTYSTVPADVENALHLYGNHGMIRYLAWYAEASKLQPGFPASGRIANAQMWLLGTKAAELLADQNPDYAAGVDAIKAKEVLDSGRGIINAALKFSEPGQDGGTNALFTNLMNRYVAGIDEYLRKSAEVEAEVDPQDKYRLFLGPDQRVAPGPEEEGPKEMPNCGFGSDPARNLNPAPASARGSMLAPGLSFARNVLPDAPAYRSCWWAMWTEVQEHTHVAPCKGTSTRPCNHLVRDGNVRLHTRQELRVDGRWLTARRVEGGVTGVLEMAHCEWEIGAPKPVCPTTFDLEKYVAENWQRHLQAAFTASGSASVEQETVRKVLEKNQAFLTQKRRDYYTGVARLYSTNQDYRRLVDLPLKLLRGYTELGFPRAITADQDLHALLYGRFALHSSMVADNPDAGEMNSLPGLFTKAAANLGAGASPWAGDQIEAGPECTGARDVDPMVVCLAHSARKRVARLAARYVHQFGQRARQADQTLPEVRNQLRSYYLVMSKIHPGADLGAPVDPQPVLTQVRADFDGDGRTDAASWRPVDGQWYVEPAAGGPARTVALGQTGDLPVPADYNADSKAEPSVFRPADHRLYTRKLEGGPVVVYDWARPDYAPRPADLPGMVKLAESLAAVASQASQPAEAIAPQQHSRDLWRKLAAADPAHRPRLARAALRLGELLSGAQRRAEAITTLREAAEIFTQLGDQAQAGVAKQRLAALGVFVGRWTLHQSNGYTVHLDAGLADSSGNFTGTATFNGIPGPVVGGKLTATNVTFEIHWTNGTPGAYLGRFDGTKWSGETHEIARPENRATWTAAVTP